MKNRLFIKTGTIVILLFSIVLFMNSSTNKVIFDGVNAAGLTGSKVQLKINEGSVTCTGWMGTLNMGSTSAAFTGTTISGTYAANAWECTDTMGSGTWMMTIKLTGDLYSSAHSFKIATGNAWICYTGTRFLLQGTTATSLTTTIQNCPAVSRLSGTHEMLNRNQINTGEIYRYGISPRIGVDVPNNQAPGTYTGVIEIGIP